MRVYSLVLFALFSIFALTAAAHGSTLCDVNDDGVVDNADLMEIRIRNGQTVPPADPKFDPNGDGRVNVADVRFCQLRKTASLPGLRVVASCDMDANSGIDRVDIELIRSLIGVAVTPGSAGDVTNDGYITMNDVRVCTLLCTNPRCAPV